MEADVPRISLCSMLQSLTHPAWPAFAVYFLLKYQEQNTLAKLNGRRMSVT